MANTANKSFSNLFLTGKEKAMNKIDKELDQEGVQSKASYFLDHASEYGFKLDKEKPETLKGFINSINSLVQLNLTGDHIVTLYNQRLELSFNNDSNLSSIKAL